MTTITLEEAQTRLKEFIVQKPGEELVIESGGQTVARLIVEPPKARKPRVPGSAIGQLTILVDDDEHLKHFQECMP